MGSSLAKSIFGDSSTTTTTAPTTTTLQTEETKNNGVTKCKTEYSLYKKCTTGYQQQYPFSTKEDIDNLCLQQLLDLRNCEKLY
jgi:hypothetical protein